MAIAAPILKSLTQSRRKLSQNKKGMDNIGRILFKRQKVKREAYAQTNMFRRKREEDDRRKQMEDQLEAPKKVTKPGGAEELVREDNNQGFFDKILGFLGYLGAGWIMNNLPTWIGMGKEFIARIQKAGEIVSGFFNNTVNLFKGSFNVLTALGKNILSFDFFDTSKRLEQSFDNLNSAINDIGKDFGDALGLVTTPLTQGKYSGEDIPEVGTKQTDPGAYVSPTPDTGAGSGGRGDSTSGGRVSPQTVYSYLRSKGLNHNHAMGILAGIEGESSFQIGVQEKGNSKQGVGLFQYTYWSRKNPFLAAVPDYKTNWKGQVDYAVNKDPQTAIYLKRSFSSPEAAAEWWLINWENPDPSLLSSRRTQYKRFISSFKPGASQPQSSQQSQSTASSTQQSQIKKSSGWQVQTPQGANVRGYSGLTPHHDYQSTSDGREVRDFTIFKDGKYISIPVPSPIAGKVTWTGFAGKGGNWVEIMSNAGKVELGHFNKILVKQGQQISAGTILGLQGATGHATGVHVHIQAASNVIRNYVNSLASGTSPSGTSPTGSVASQQPSQQPAQIAAAPRQSQAVPSAITPERKGQDIIIAQQPNQQQIITSPSGGGDQQAPVLINEFDLLNNFIKNKLLLDLAYL